MKNIMDTNMYYSKIIKDDLVNGTGVGVTLFVSGCEFACPGCYNESAWNFNSGKPFTDLTMNEILYELSKPFVDHISILGGEPLHPNNLKDVRKLMLMCKFVYPKKKVWLWTGYTRSYWKNLGLENIVDFLIDGRYEKDNPTTKLFRGSDNQKLWASKDGKWEKLN